MTLLGGCVYVADADVIVVVAILAALISIAISIPAKVLKYVCIYVRRHNEMQQQCCFIGMPIITVIIRTLIAVDILIVRIAHIEP